MSKNLLRNNYLTFFLLVSLVQLSCQPEDERIIDDPSIQLSFEKDTVFFDTLFTSVGSITRRFKVYNKRTNAVRIRSIQLGDKDNSPYSIYVNGIEGKAFGEQILNGMDSMLILVKVFINPTVTNMPFIVEDSVNFETAGYPQNVKLLAWGQNANFLNDSILVCNTTWIKDLPFVILNSVLVDQACSLTVEAGTQIFFHNNSAMFVAGKLIVAGTKDEPVTFANDRLDEPYKSTPGQWDGIFFLEGSAGNVINYAEIRNSVFGIWLGTPDEDDLPDLELANSKIENISNTGLIAFTSDLNAYNLVVNNCGEFTIANLAGGNYTYTHLTTANYSYSFFRNNPSVIFSDYVELADGSQIKDDLNVTVLNSILWGSLEEELLFDLQSTTSFFSFHHNLIKTQIDTFSVNNQLNIDPIFIDPELFNYRIDTLSPAKNAGIPSFVISDLDGVARDANPDLGAYEIKN